MTYRVCPDCRRQIAEDIFERWTAHAPGCKYRRAGQSKSRPQPALKEAT